MSYMRTTLLAVFFSFFISQSDRVPWLCRGQKFLQSRHSGR